ncbi:MAG TPA: iron ABC transporter substrate-binding protein [Gammaproteobacteria bacterium]|jgi:iron(III) transport system substrate-binding protein|nr:iron ABC transporter substrate-binding protein [Acidiferrobacteraceae bacterium]MDP6398229.1 Fe(3+) ABC transporter substrate-binding protein [Arenicellales bacterium]HCX86577.1 iron ABC transporter substrate-binding protein [Gammaproteobacteria bacterium]MDP6552066.1 Fe(3+) ABC transporter substrate-binding protein [Arenicellales bacterium]MDP6791578.1 Fe(3+) ABC transporter substrate-binding protein [Arenicellales bacterium]|tara:strand:- start:3539 stop:4573 length:1035 start_codon:yes stop_codon:yes gene_type:complete
MHVVLLSTFRLILSTLLVGVSPSSVLASEPGEINVYSYRKPQLIDPMFAVFTEQTSIRVNSVFAKKGMLERLKSEGRNTPADLVFTVDIGRLSDIKDAGLTQAVSAAAVQNNIPAHYRDSEGHWFGLTTRARIIVASKDRVGPGEILSYEDLADPKWKGRICTRSGKHPYMVALIASMIAHHGEAAAKAWLAGVKNNLARKPQGNDRAQVKAIKEGVCDLAVINHYYMAKMLKDPEQVPWAESVNVIFPNQDGRGTHMNVSGMALTRHAPNKNNALKLMAFLASDQGQQMYVQENGEYPVKAGIPWNDLQKSWGPFKEDALNLTDVAQNRAVAIRLADEVRYNN